MKLACFYHCFADGAYEQPVHEQAAALLDSGWGRRAVRVGVVGSPENRRAAVKLMRAYGLRVIVVAEEASGFEQVTLRPLHRYAEQRPGGIMYAHTKGASNPSSWAHQWRASMTSLVVRRWRELSALLADFDIIGAHWLTPTDYPDSLITPFFGGNFWMARCGYLARLPPVGHERADAEGWIGLGSAPRVLDLKPGWPSERLCDGLPNPVVR